MPHCPNFWIQAENAARLYPALQRIAREYRGFAVAVDFGPSRNRHTGIRTIDTFEDGSFVIVHKSGFREVFTSAKRIFVVSAKNRVLGVDSESTKP